MLSLFGRILLNIPFVCYLIIARGRKVCSSHRLDIKIQGNTPKFRFPGFFVTVAYMRIGRFREHESCVWIQEKPYRQIKIIGNPKSERFIQVWKHLYASVKVNDNNKE